MNIDLSDLHKENYAKFIMTTQTEYICDKEGNILVDYIGKFEDLNNSWNFIKNIIKVDKELQHIRKTTSEKIKLNEESKRKIYEFYKKDFEILGYYNGSRKSTNKNRNSKRSK